MGPIRRVKTGTEAPNSSIAGSDRSPIDAVGVGNRYSTLRPPKDTSRPTSSNGTAPTAVVKSSKGERKSKEVAGVTDDTANTILDYLKLHCLQTRLHDDAVDFLYGPGQGKEIYRIPMNPLIFLPARIPQVQVRKSKQRMCMAEGGRCIPLKHTNILTRLAHRKTDIF